VKVRRARKADLGAIAHVAGVVWRTSYADLLDSDTIEHWLKTAYSEASLEQRLQDHPIFVVQVDGLIASFADVYVQENTIVIGALCTHPEYRRLGVASTLLDKARSLAPSLPLTADLLLGNKVAERFVEHLGFRPGETLEVHLYGKPIMERRWWIEPSLIS
jgi:ribosomal protein S18 acetylase RimI-like enzyme